MFKNYLRTTLRSLWKNKTYSFLNIFGLAIGIACAALIFLWVEDEVSFDKNNLKKSSIYLVKINDDIDGGVFTHSSTPGPMAAALQADMPDVVNTCRTTEGEMGLLFSSGEKSMYGYGKYTDSSLFSIFTLPFVQGNAKTAFLQLNSIVLTEKMAKNFFGDELNVIGKTIRIDNKEEYVVTGVVKDLPENSTLQFEWLAPFQNYYVTNPGLTKWWNFGLTTYIELRHGANPVAIDRQLKDYIQKKQGADASTVHAFLFAMNDWRLYDDFSNGKKSGGGRIQYIHLFTLIAWIILIIACINFMNLATARSEKRAREVGVRKVLGSGKSRLIVQFLADAMFLASLAAILAIIMIGLMMPAFNLLVQKNLSPHFGNSFHILALVILILICGLMAGSYPALYLSSFNPVYVLKGIRVKTGSAALIRKGLVILQFTVSIILIIGTIIIYKQIQYVKSRNIGYSKDNLIQMYAPADVVKNFTVIKEDLLNTNLIDNVALADHETLEGGNNTTGINWQGKDPNRIMVISQRVGSAEFLSTVGMHFTEGRDFKSTDIVKFRADMKPVDSAQVFNVVITESMEKVIGKGSAVGKILTRGTDNGDYKLNVIGVVKDYVYGDMYGVPSPVIFYCIPQAGSLLYLRIKANSNTETVLSQIGSVMRKDNPAYPFKYKFVDDEFNKRFMSEMLISKLSRVFASLAVIISCLGLFGLAAYTAERRTKEVGIRKVLGASVTGISALLSKDFLKLVALSCIIAFPVAWWLMHNWLQNYEYRIEINWWIFLIAGISAMLIALITISFQAIRAAVANPVISLRTE